MYYKEWRYKRLKKKIKKDKALLGYIGNRIQKNMKKAKDMENAGHMMVISE